MAWFENNGIRLRFNDEGAKTAPALLLLHEIGMCIETWDHLTSLLIKKFRIVRLDLRSHGLSQPIKTVPKMPELVDDVSALLRHCQITSPVIICGAAVGGAIGLSFAACYPEQTRHVIAASPATGVPADARTQALAMADQIEAHGFQGILGEGGLESLFPEPVRTSDDLFQHFLNLSYVSNNQTIANYLRMVASLDIAAQLATIKCPVTLLGGRYDAMRPYAVVEELASNIPVADYHTIDSGHYASVQAPHILAGYISCGVA